MLWCSGAMNEKSPREGNAAGKGRKYVDAIIVRPKSDIPGLILGGYKTDAVSPFLGLLRLGACGEYVRPGPRTAEFQPDCYFLLLS